MDCRRFERCLTGLLFGTLEHAEHRACLEHAAACDACRELLELAEQGARPDDPESMIREILEQTSGEPCARCRELLPAVVDDELSPAERFLVERHAARCGECAATLHALRELEGALPGLRDLCPDPRFVADVMKATVPWPRRARRRATRTFGSWLRRPRFAMEAAFTVVVLCTVVFQATGVPLAALPAHAAQIVDPDVVFVMDVGEIVVGLGARLQAVAEWLEIAILEPLLAFTTNVLDVWRDAVQTAWSSLSTTFGTICDELASLLTNVEPSSEGSAAQGQTGERA